jgi:hypothetical protein
MLRTFAVWAALGLAGTSALAAQDDGKPHDGDPAASASSRPSAPGKPPGPPVRPSDAPPFDMVVRGAERIEGLVTVWQRDDRVWVELMPQDFGRTMFFSPKLARGIGEGWLFGGKLIGRRGPAGQAQIVTWRRQFNQVQLVALNRQFVAAEGTPQAHAVRQAFADSLLAAAPVASQPHPQRGSILVDARPLFLGDMLGLGSQLQRTYRQGYGLDARNTFITAVRGRPDQLVLEIQAHFATGSLSVGVGGGEGGGRGGPGGAASLPGTVPDARSLLLGLHYTLQALPAEPMRPRAADPRLGHFTTDVIDFSRAPYERARQRFVERWRLDKRDPAAELSEPVRPIVFWIDRSVPPMWRDAVERGVRAWNPAFERIGFKEALVVRRQRDDAELDTLEADGASIRWITSARPAFDGYGPSVADPRSGEILDADIVIDGRVAQLTQGLRRDAEAGGPRALGGSATRAAIAAELARAMQVEPSASISRGAPTIEPGRIFSGSGVPPWGSSWDGRSGGGGDGVSGDFADHSGHVHGHDHGPGAVCSFAGDLASQAAFGIELLVARGDLPDDPDSPEVRALVEARVEAIVAHEVGHALGLRHNFAASRAYSPAQLADPAFTAAHGTTASVMDYPDLNLPPSGVRLAAHGAVFSARPGPYDVWAVEYAYRPLPADEEAQALARIAERSAEPLLAFGTDEDRALGIDPQSLAFDLGNDPLAFATARLTLAREWLDRQVDRQPRAQGGWSLLRTAVQQSARDVARAAGALVRQIGGVSLLRDRPGSGRDPLQPVPAEVQRQALALLLDEVLAPGRWRIPPTLQRRLASDFAAGPGGDFAWHDWVSGLQKMVVSRLTDDAVAQRLLDSADKIDAGVAEAALGPAELHARLRVSLWRELGEGRDIDPLRREVQRYHAERLAERVLQPGSDRADLRSLDRSEALALRTMLREATAAEAARPQRDAVTAAHLRDSLELLEQALSARVVRPAV